MEHLEVTASSDMEAWTHEDNPSMPVQPVRVGFEPMPKVVYVGDWVLQEGFWKAANAYQD